jgi:hypothetical protein
VVGGCEQKRRRGHRVRFQVRHGQAADHRPQDGTRAAPVSLGELFAGYRDNYPKGAKEANTRYTERIHVAHLERLMGRTTKIHTITGKTLQQYVGTRAREKSKLGRTIGSPTIKKEIGTFTAVWNQWAIPQGLVAAPLSTKFLIFDKERTKPPFQTPTWRHASPLHRSMLNGPPGAKVVAPPIGTCYATPTWRHPSANPSILVSLLKA